MAIQYAKDLKDQNEKLRQSQKTFQSSYGDEFGQIELNLNLALSKQALRQATEAGDSEAIATATEALSMATADKARHEQYLTTAKTIRCSRASLYRTGSTTTGLSTSSTCSR
jgi:hypothetical protein